MAGKKKRYKGSKARQMPLATGVVANLRGEIFELEGYAAVGMRGTTLAPLEVGGSVPIPFGSEMMLLPDRLPILYNLKKKAMEVLSVNPYDPEEEIFPVAAFNSPGYVVTDVSAYEEKPGASHLPLFSYGAVGWADGGFRSAVYQVDKERRQDLRLMPFEKVKEGVALMQEKMPENRLRGHLENCALNYGCPAAKNFFLGRFEAPLPTSRQCNARCLGCISLQKSEQISCCQERIAFTPTPDEIAGIALTHIRKVDRSVVSFGQGCEGDPLLAADVIGPAVTLIREATDRGTINMNTNGSLPDVLEKLFDRGLDSIRVSMNSTRNECYTAYFRPQGYEFNDVIRSIDMGIRKGRFVAINYLNCPGITDTPEEVDALFSFIQKHPINLIQWRNLNFDPLRYFGTMRLTLPQGKPMGIKNVIRRLKKEFPHLKHGYFNPPKENFQIP